MYGNAKTGRANARMVQKETLYITHGNGVSSSLTLVKKIPWPSYKAKSAKKYRKTKYSVYEIYGLAPGNVAITWKYGITCQADENTRPRSQYSKCEHWMAAESVRFGDRILPGQRIRCVVACGGPGGCQEAFDTPEAQAVSGSE